MTQVPVLPRNIVVPQAIVDSFFPEVTRVVSIGPDETSLGDPKATISVIYGNSDSSVKVTITVDAYRSSQDASSAFQQALEASEKVPGFHPIPTPKLGQQAFAGSVTMGGETHIGSGVLNGRLIVGVTLAGFDATRQNITKLITIIGIENTIVRLTEPLLYRSGIIRLDDAETSSNALFGGSRGASDTVVSFSQASGDRFIAGSGAGKDSITLGLGNDTVVETGAATLYGSGGGGNFYFTHGSGGTDWITAGSGATSISGGKGGEDSFVGGAGSDSMDAAGAKSAVFSFGALSHSGTHPIRHFDSAPDKLHLVGYDTTQAPASAHAVGGSMILHLRDGTTIMLHNFTGLDAKHFG